MSPNIFLRLVLKAQLICVPFEVLKQRKLISVFTEPLKELTKRVPRFKIGGVTVLLQYFDFVEE